MRLIHVGLIHGYLWHLIASKLNSTFGMIGNATADKMTAKVFEKLGPLALA